MVIFVTKTSCPRREMTSLALTVCAHIAATLIRPGSAPLSISFCPFNPDTQPSVCPTLRLAVVEVMEREMGVAPGDMPLVSRGVEVMGRGMGMAQAGMPIDLAGGGGDGKGEGDGSGGYVICLAAGGGGGKGAGGGSGGYALGLAAGGGNGRYHALVLSGAEVNPPESLLVL